MTENVILTVKPKFNIFVRFFSVNSIIAMIVAVGLMEFSANLLYSVIKDINPAYFFMYIFAGILVLMALSDLMNYKATGYNVYENRIDFEEGFINHKNTTINMKDIREIHFNQNFIQRMAGLGTIKFVTAANNSNISTGVEFKDIQDSKHIYDEVKRLHENQN